LKESTQTIIITNNATQCTVPYSCSCWLLSSLDNVSPQCRVVNV